MSTFAHVFLRRNNPIRRLKPYAQDEESKLMESITPFYFFINALVAALATDQVMTAPRLLILLLF